MNTNDVQIGFEYEFFNNNPTEDALLKLQKLLNKEIIYFNKSHSDFKPDKDKWKLEKDFSGGKEMLELISGPTDYNDAIDNLTKVFSYIKSNGYTDEHCAFQINISFNDINKMNKINRLKLILEIDENKIYEKYPNRENSLYAKSIKFVIPKNHYYIENIINVNSDNYIIPNSKYYGVNFLKLEKNYLEFRYLGGTDYEKKLDDSILFINYFITLMNKSLGLDFTDQQKNRLKAIINNNNDLLNSYNSYNKFVLSYPNIHLYVNLIKTPIYINTFYDTIRDSLFNIIRMTEMKEGIINYNSDTSTFEIKDAKLDRVFQIENIDFISCEVTGNLNNCNFFNCKIKDSIMDACKIYQDSEIENSKVEQCYISENSTIDNSYITGGKHMIVLGKISNCIFRSGRLTEKNKNEATNTKFVDFKIIK